MEGSGSSWGRWADLPTPRPEPTLRPALDFRRVPVPAPPALRVDPFPRWRQRWVGTAGVHAASPRTLRTAGPSPAALELGDVLMPPLHPDQQRERGGPGLTLRSPTAEARLQRLGCQVCCHVLEARLLVKRVRTLSCPRWTGPPGAGHAHCREPRPAERSCRSSSRSLCAPCRPSAWGRGVSVVSESL